MKILTNTKDSVEVFEGAELTKFSIKPSGKAFKTLIDSLYSDKIKAPMRELSTNAYDAHVEAGKRNVPFKVKLPTMLDTSFYVRDFGNGMTHEQVVGLYTTLFDSSKEDTNRQVGMLGLGSKSPFSYTNTFTVTVWQNGVERVYSAFLGEDKTPYITKISELPSSEKTGVKVEFDVNTTDINAFKDKANELYTWFDPVPTFVRSVCNIKQYSIIKKTVSGNGWSLPSERLGQNLRGPYAKQGCVVYPIVYSSIPNIPDNVRLLLTTNIVIEFPIGTIDVAPSREALSYDDMTCKNIVARCNSIINELSDKISNTITNCVTRVQACKRYSEIAKEFPYALRGTITATWNGMDVSSSDIRLSDIVDSNAKNYQYSIAVSGYHLKETNRPSVCKGGPRDYGIQYVFSITSDTIYAIVYSLVDKVASINKIGDRLKKLQETTNFPTGKSVIYVHGISEELLGKYKTELSGILLLNIEDYVPDKPNTSVKKTQATKKTEVKVRDISRNRWGEIKTVEVSGDGYYILCRGSTLLLNNGGGPQMDLGTDTYYLNHRVSAINSLFEGKNIHLVSSTYQNRLQGMREIPWKEGTEYMMEQFSEKLKQLYTARDTSNNIYSYTNKRAIPQYIHNIKRGLDLNNLTNGSLREMYEAYSSYIKSYKQYDSSVLKSLQVLADCTHLMRSTRNFIERTNVKDVIAQKLLMRVIEYKDKVMEIYPLLKHLEYAEESDVVNYIAMVQATQSLKST